MKLHRLVLITIILFSFTSPLFSENVKLIPRRIRILSHDMPPMVSTIFYASLVKNILLVVDDVHPHNIFEFESGDRIKLKLSDREGEVDSREYPLELFDDPIAMATAFEELAKEWAQYLEMVPPEISEESVAQLNQIKQEIAIEEDIFSRPFQATLWLPLDLTQAIRQREPTLFWPIRGDFSWYFTKNMGMITSFRFNIGNNFLFLGMGIQYRTLGKISVEMNLLFNLANKLMDGKISNSYGITISIEPTLVWTMTPHWSLKARLVGFEFNEPIQIGTNSGTDLDLNDSDFWLDSYHINYISIGVSYSWKGRR